MRRERECIYEWENTLVEDWNKGGEGCEFKGGLPGAKDEAEGGFETFSIMTRRALGRAEGVEIVRGIETHRIGSLDLESSRRRLGAVTSA